MPCAFKLCPFSVIFYLRSHFLAPGDASVAELILFNKPFKVLCQFTDEPASEGQASRSTLADWICLPGIYPAGRLDYDSEGLLLLTSDGTLQHRIASPGQNMPENYWVQVEGNLSASALDKLTAGLLLKYGTTWPTKARIISDPQIWPRTPPVRRRVTKP